jgi:hypothetical protein
MHPRSRQAEHKARPTSANPSAPAPPEEVLVADSRAGLTPSDMVERKLLYLLRGGSVAGSHTRMPGPHVRGGTAR